jgi:hypothetical protein
VSKHVVPVGSVMVGPGGFEGPAFDWLDGGKAYLLYGASVFETETGQFIGDLGIEGVRAQVADGSTGCQLVRANDAGRVQIDAVTLDLGKGRGAADTGDSRKPRVPTTRRTASAGQPR